MYLGRSRCSIAFGWHPYFFLFFLLSLSLCLSHTCFAFLLSRLLSSFLSFSLCYRQNYSPVPRINVRKFSSRFSTRARACPFSFLLQQVYLLPILRNGCKNGRWQHGRAKWYRFGTGQPLVRTQQGKEKGCLEPKELKFPETFWRNSPSEIRCLSASISQNVPLSEITSSSIKKLIIQQFRLSETVTQFS